MSAAAADRAVLVARAVFDEVIERLREHFEVQHNQADAVWSQDELIRRLQGIGRRLRHRHRGHRRRGCWPPARSCARCARWRWATTTSTSAACTARGVLVSNAPDVLTETTADFGFALMMAAARRISESEHFLRAGQWTRWGHDMFAGADVHGATLGVLGMGRIGQAIARRGALGFGMPVIYHNRIAARRRLSRRSSARATSPRTSCCARPTTWCWCCPIGPQSHHAIGAAELALMKPTATLTNVARGGVVDDAALAQALRERRIAAAGLDVFEGEPAVHPELLTLPNVVLTPHIASASLPTRRAMAQLAADNLIAALGAGPQAGTPPTALNPQVLGAAR